MPLLAHITRWFVVVVVARVSNKRSTQKVYLCRKVCSQGTFGCFLAWRARCCLALLPRVGLGWFLACGARSCGNLLYCCVWLGVLLIYSFSRLSPVQPQRAWNRSGSKTKCCVSNVRDRKPSKRIHLHQGMFVQILLSFWSQQVTRRDHQPLTGASAQPRSCAEGEENRCTSIDNPLKGVVGAQRREHTAHPILSPKCSKHEVTIKGENLKRAGRPPQVPLNTHSRIVPGVICC
jgi:hypothetical protein